MLALSLFLPWWPAEMRRRRCGLSRRTGIILWRKVHQQEVVAGCCALAARSGVAPGMSVAHARAALRGPVHAAEIDDAALARALRRLAHWMLRWTPRVCLDPPDGLLLDMTGCEWLYGGPDIIVRRVRCATARLGLTARAACAPTWGAAWAMARFGASAEVVVPADGLRAALGPLPVEALRAPHLAAAMLREVGVVRVDQVLALGRTALAARYGPQLLLRLDQALGEAVETTTPLRQEAPARVERAFAGPTSHLEAVLLCARELVESLCELLDRRGRGLHRLQVRLTRSDLAPAELCIRTSRPTRDPAHLWALLRPRLERAHLGFGVDGLRLDALHLAPIPHEQRTTHPGEPGEADRADVARLVDTVAARLGPERVLAWRAAESYIPERAFVPALLTTLDTPTTPTTPSTPAARTTTPQLPPPDRPSLLHEPREVEAIVLLPDGPIAALQDNGITRRIATCTGPERIAAEWWRGGSGLRDYFAVRTDDGAALWVYREWPSGRWFLHGEWA